MQQLDCELNWLSMNARQMALEPWKSKISKVNIYVNKHILLINRGRKCTNKQCQRF